MREKIFWLSLIGIAWMIQTYLGMKQVKNFNNEFIKLNKEGKVVVGKSKGAFFNGCIVMFTLQNNKIIKGKIIEGVTVFAKVKDFEDFNGLLIHELEGVLPNLKLRYPLKKALKNVFS